MNELNLPAAPAPQVIEAFSSAAITALQELAQLEASLEEVPIAVADLSNIVSASIRLARPIPGKMTLILTEETASRLAGRYLPNETLLTEEIVDDVTGEIANVIAGQAKTILKGTPYHYKMSTPVVAREASISLLPGNAATMLVASLITEAGSLILLVNLSPCPGA